MKLLISLLVSSIFMWNLSQQTTNYLFGIITILLTSVAIYLSYKSESLKKNEILEKVFIKIENIPLPTYITDINGKLLYGNSEFKKLLGIENINFVCDLTEIFTNLSSRELKDDIEKILKEKQPIVKEKFLNFPNQQSGWYQIHKTPITNNNENMHYIQVYLKDITAEKEVCDQRKRFVATLTHDLKTPIIAQIRSLEMLLNGNFGRINKNQKEILELTINSCDNIYSMVSTILSLYKLENNEIELNYEEINFVELIMECCAEVQKEAEEKQINFIIKTDTNNNKVLADRQYIKPAVLFLLQNSIAYSYRSTSIEILINKDNDNLTFEIIAKSPYIEEKTLKTMLHKYLGQISNYNKIGFCMKLNFCNQVIKAHKGQFVAKSTVNDENTLGFRLPISIMTGARI